MERAEEEKKKRYYLDAFNYYDSQGRGFINFTNLVVVMRALMKNPTEADIQKARATYDRDNSDLISSKDFLCLMNQTPDLQESVEDIVAAFRIFDREGNGFIRSAELRYLMTNYGARLNNQEADVLIQDADIEGDGQINYEEFVHMMADKLKYTVRGEEDDNRNK